MGIGAARWSWGCSLQEREFFIDNLLVRVHLIIEMIWWNGLAPWEFESPFSGSLTSTFLCSEVKLYRGVMGVLAPEFFLPDKQVLAPTP